MCVCVREICLSNRQNKRERVSCSITLIADSLTKASHCQQRLIENGLYWIKWSLLLHLKSKTNPEHLNTLAPLTLAPG